ncbi:hypothetical protein BH10ACT7_BH10ACT7_03380 [soil metagenome]
MRRLLAIAVLAIAGVFAVAAPAAADTSDFTFDSFDVQYTLGRADDGTSTLSVVETIVARFPEFDQNRGIIRAIPDDYSGVNLDTSVQSVVDENGTPVFYETEYDGEFVVLALGTDDFVHGPTTYVISYTQANVVRNFDDTASDEFYWDVNGTGWQQPFGRVSADVTVEPSLVSALSGNQACYYGAENSTTQCEITSPTAGEFSASVDDLGPGENLSVAIGFAPGTFVTPEPTGPRPPQEVPLVTHLLTGGIGLLSLGGVAAAIFGRRQAGGAKGRGIIIPQYSEPDDITILQAAHLMKRPSTAIPAALVRLAVRKNIRILAYAVVIGGEPYSLQYLGDAGANAEDQALLTMLFGADPQPGAIREFGQSDQSLMTTLMGLSTRAGDSLEPSGFLRKPGGRGLAVAAIVLQVLLAVATLAVLMQSAAAYSNVSVLVLPVVIVGTAALITCIALAVVPAQPTDKGADARDYLLGMRMYLTLAEQDRMRALQSPSGAERVNVNDNLEMIKLYEKLLPWAVLWGVEDQWMRELAVRVDAVQQQPDWFVGTNGFTPSLFSSTVRGFGTALTPPVSTSSWSGSSFGSSFSGGSFGGGFSGGGGGGGGGGGR